MSTANGIMPGEVTPTEQAPVQSRPVNAGMSGAVALPTGAEVSHARLPAAYQAAKVSLANCANLDECQDWANKAEALASYGRQANDDTLRKHAERIQARAIRRCGILLAQIEASKGGYAPSFDAHTGTDTSITRTQAATNAGLSKRQKDTALRVANVPEDEFEAAVESDEPPTVTQIAAAGTKRKPLIDLHGIPPEVFQHATRVGGDLRDLAECCKTFDPVEIAGGFLPNEISKIKAHVRAIDAWLDVFINNLKEHSKVIESGISLEDQYVEHRREVAALPESAKAKFERLTKTEVLLLQGRFRAEVRKEFERTVPERLEEVAKQEKRLIYEIRKYQMMRDGIGQFWTEE